MTPPTAPRQPLHILAFDTSTEKLALGLHTPAGEHSRLTGGGALASAALLPQVQGLLAEAGLAMADLDAIAFGRGPGAFTGLRTSCAVAQGLGLGLALPLLPLDSLLIVAEDARVQAGLASGEVAVAMDARMDEVYAGRYRWQGGVWQVMQEPALLSLAALAEAWAGSSVDVLAGSALAAFGKRLAVPACGQRFEQEDDRAGALLRLAVRAAQAGEGVDAAAALPLYLRDRVALTTREREAARVAAGAAGA
ncbi:putative Inactive homolog of metal-dependent proteases, molecular chaperone [Rubrivivax sp. A210]|uniref:tRNA (adenosine(37)-N6)-threonylcarbamoyltransferase complex dimerization subunit type 1 TsaB n=1 Tax=Rubrivivax sp. A210 TaxID=2772301 RepID=UPI0019CDA77E|nr:tRNA (adenosine(37)-N6)-threonylcarbamoyltransferase complex dimerization subunit type 1 TsaB [Rubrivivax sp. A210]CAD5374183.1 putative Inactive homolog of metal-dependent proteases, molecular chaperone [Rubrivivax sp. A210]